MRGGAANGGEPPADEAAEVEAAVAQVSEPDGAHSAGTAENTVVSVQEEIQSTKEVEDEGDKGESSDKRVVETDMGDVREADGGPNETGMEQTVFKVPLKRKKSDKVCDFRHLKKMDLEGASD